jgi:hypothetical protein
MNRFSESTRGSSLAVDRGEGFAKGDFVIIDVAVKHRRKDGKLELAPRSADRWQVMARIEGTVFEYEIPSRSRGASRSARPTVRQAERVLREAVARFEEEL